MNSSDARVALLAGADKWEQYRSALAASQEAPDLSFASLVYKKLNGLNLAGVDFSEANLSGADLTNADLRGADLTNADLRGADLTNADLHGADLSGADLTAANLDSAELTGARLSAATTDVRGLPFSYSLRFGGKTPEERRRDKYAGLNTGVVRIRMELPEGIDPQLLADYAMSVSVAARLASRVGARLEPAWFGDSTSAGATDVLVATAADSATFAVRRSHYGSPLEIDLVEMVPSIVTAAGAAAGAAAAFVARKRGSNLLSFLFTLARKEERDLWLQERVVRRETLLERERANTAVESLRRARSQKSVAKLRIHPASEAEARRRVSEATPDPETRELILEAIPDLMPLLAGGVTVITSTSDESR
ncbi:uncharacterized protein YjbI with pentapeptide repeats [Arthrobacter sp. UYNi723]